MPAAGFQNVVGAPDVALQHLVEAAAGIGHGGDVQDRVHPLQRGVHGTTIGHVGEAKVIVGQLRPLTVVGSLRTHDPPAAAIQIVAALLVQVSVDHVADESVDSRDVNFQSLVVHGESLEMGVGQAQRPGRDMVVVQALDRVIIVCRRLDLLPGVLFL